MWICSVNFIYWLIFFYFMHFANPENDVKWSLISPWLFEDTVREAFRLKFFNFGMKLSNA